MGNNNLNPQITLAGRSMIFNVLFVILNLAGLALITVGSHQSLDGSGGGLKIAGYALLIISSFALIIFRGRLMMTAVARVLVGGLFIVSGLVKANDPIGFSYKLEEYFEDGALAFRIKEFFGAPGFSLEFFMEFALLLSVIICIAEIVLGVFLIIGGKIKLVSYLIVLMMLFFTFLTWHTASCDNTQKFRDRDTYSLSISSEAEIAKRKIEEAKTNKDLKVISKSKSKVVIDEKKLPQCVDDCGCFGDAMKGSVGRSLSPSESLWKDIVVLYLCIWIFISQWIIKPNNRRQNVILGVASLVVIAFFAWIFSWYFTILFAFISIMSALWIRRSGGGILGNYFGSALIVSLLCALFVFFVLRYEPMKDYRPYAYGSNLIEKMNDGREGKYQSMLRYKHKKTKEEKMFDSASKAYMNSKIWEDSDWEYVDMVQMAIVETRIPSITDQFGPFVAVEDLTDAELALDGVMKIIADNQMRVVKVENLSSQEVYDVPMEEFSEEEYDPKYYTVLDTVFQTNPEFSEVEIRDFILESKEIVVITSKNLLEGNWAEITKYKSIYAGCKKAKIPFVILCSASRAQIIHFKKKYNFDAPIFVNDETELKAIARSNPSMMILKKGTVVGKFAHRSTPTFEWLNTNVLN